MIIRENTLKLGIFKTDLNERQRSGVYELNWDSIDDDKRPVPFGIYLYCLSADYLVKINKMRFLK